MTDDRRAVKETYDRIAAHFSKTREYPWPEVEAFVAESTASSVTVGLDVGCGNGRHLELLADTTEYCVGVDASRPLLAEAANRLADNDVSATLIQGDAASLPLADDTVDLAVYVATLHHLPNRDARRGSLDELARVLSPGGRALVSAWSTEHDRFDADDGFDTTVDWTLPGGKTVPRFYHIYDPAEFEDEIAASGLVVESTRVSSGNCYATVSVEQ